MHSKTTSLFATGIEESKVVLETVLGQQPTVLADRTEVDSTIWREVGAKLGRAPDYVANHWREVIRPLLVRHQAGTLDMDYFPPLIHYMLDQKLQFT